MVPSIPIELAGFIAIIVGFLFGRARGLVPASRRMEVDYDYIGELERDIWGRTFTGNPPRPKAKHCLPPHQRSQGTGLTKFQRKMVEAEVFSSGDTDVVYK